MSFAMRPPSSGSESGGGSLHPSDDEILALLSDETAVLITKEIPVTPALIGRLPASGAAAGCAVGHSADRSLAGQAIDRDSRRERLDHAGPDPCLYHRRDDAPVNRLLPDAQG